MLEQELKDIWNNSSQTEKISIDKKQLLVELNTKVNKLQKTIRKRDIREISASVIGIILFSYLLYEIPFPITKIACLLSIIWFVVVIIISRNSKAQNSKSNLSLSITELLANQEKTMKKQERLLNSAAYWYSAPSFLTNFIFILGLGNPTDYNWTNSIAVNLLPLANNSKVLVLIGLALFYTFIVWINKRAVARDINPLLERINKMQHQLKD